jgi:DNA replication protein DnaC
MPTPKPASREAICEKHGKFTQEQIGLFREIWSRCPACEKAREDAEQEARHLAEIQQAYAAWEAKLDAAGIPERFRDRTLDNYRAETDAQKNALQWANDYANGFDDALATGRSMLFLGRPGTGKTHLACGICAHLLRKGSTVYYSTVQRAMRRVKGTWARDADETEAQAIAAMTKPDLLVLDEIGVQFGSDTERNLLFDILNERYEKCMPTLLLSNYGKEDVAKYLGERVMDRLREDGGRVVTFDWDSYRRKS